MALDFIKCSIESVKEKRNSIKLSAVVCCFTPDVIYFLFSMHSYSTLGLYGLNDLMTQVSIRKANLTWHKRSRQSKEYRLFTRCRACIPNAAWQVSSSLYVFDALKYISYFKYVCADS